MNNVFKIAFEVVAPSIPGYGCQVACARVLRKLMERLNIKKFYLQGGDWGSLITSNLAKLYPAQVFGLHLNMLAAMPDASLKVAALEIIGSLFPKVFNDFVVEHYIVLGLRSVLPFPPTSYIGSKVRDRYGYDQSRWQYLAVPTAHFSGLNEMFDRTPPELSSVLYNLTHYTEAPDVGHFAAFEMPRPLAVDIFEFVKKLER
ncbi:hypothetical protein TELCIR_00786 [Teladorsagia circumcincta]|uniref:AB hydrolase-1 domain-containing protein n=1 Tax=Teladorsagia circumcincta TaxID=45464 RepID=A0A2G9V409_TELCI|nr:hypothetical protein TELCIR_00786 [Teladorsagia circumcincta]